MHSRGKVIGLYVCVVSAQKSPDLEIYESVRDVITTNPEVSMKKLPSVLFELQNMVHKLYKSCTFPSAYLRFTDRTHSAGQLV